MRNHKWDMNILVKGESTLICMLMECFSSLSILFGSILWTMSWRQRFHGPPIFSLASYMIVEPGEVQISISIVEATFSYSKLTFRLSLIWLNGQSHWVHHMTSIFIIGICYDVQCRQYACDEQLLFKTCELKVTGSKRVEWSIVIFCA